jgi:hypothetical protein
MKNVFLKVKIVARNNTAENGEVKNAAKTIPPPTTSLLATAASMCTPILKLSHANLL